MREEEKQKFQKGESKMQRSLRKRWVFPAVYIASAALILTGVLWFQSSGGDETQAPDEFSYEAPADNEQLDTSINNPEAVQVTSTQENIQMPVHDEQGIFVQKQFYDYDATTEDQEAALVFYNNTYYPNTGVDYAMESGESFDVLASLSGTVVEVEEDSILGNTIKIEHEDGISTHYSSLGEVHVEAGQSIDQGSVIGTAGRNVYNSDAGVHVHFEIRADDSPVNPIEYINQPLSKLFEDQEAKEEDAENEKVDSEQPAEPSNNEEQTTKPSEEEKSEGEAKDPASEEKPEDSEEGADTQTPDAASTTPQA